MSERTQGQRAFAALNTQIAELRDAVMLANGTALKAHDRIDEIGPCPETPTATLEAIKTEPTMRLREVPVRAGTVPVAIRSADGARRRVQSLAFTTVPNRDLATVLEALENRAAVCEAQGFPMPRAARLATDRAVARLKRLAELDGGG